jgi:hypothetical protein
MSQLNDERWAFLVDYFDPNADLMRQYQLLYYLGDSTLEMVRRCARPFCPHRAEPNLLQAGRLPSHTPPSPPARIAPVSLPRLFPHASSSRCLTGVATATAAAAAPTATHPPLRRAVRHQKPPHVA